MQRIGDTGPPPAHGLKRGDAVLYVPHEIHALTKNAKGDFPYEFGLLLPGAQDAGTDQPRVRRLTGKELDEAVLFIQRHPNPAEERRRLVALRPIACWPAVVRNVNPDGMVDLDVASNNSGMTLHEDGIRLAAVNEPWSPHTCRLIPEGDKDPYRNVIHDQLRENLPALPPPEVVVAKSFSTGKG